MINFDAVDFSERRSEEVISFFWCSVYISFFQVVWSENAPESEATFFPCKKKAVLQASEKKMSTNKCIKHENQK